MKIKLIVPVLLVAAAVWAQGPGKPMVRDQKGNVFYRRELGKWWQDPEIAGKLQLNDGQISQLNQIFYDHKLKLIGFGAEMEKQDLKLQTLLDADVPNEGEVVSQVDYVLKARGRLEREYTMMNLDLRKVLSLDQWRQLKSIRGEGALGDRMFFHRIVPGPGGPLRAPLPPGAGEGSMPPPPPPPPGDDL